MTMRVVAKFYPGNNAEWEQEAKDALEAFKRDVLVPMGAQVQYNLPITEGEEVVNYTHFPDGETPVENTYTLKVVYIDGHVHFDRVK